MVKLKLTPLGRKTVESFIPRLVDYYNALLTDFSHHDAEMLVHLLTKLNTQLSKPGGLPCGS